MLYELGERKPILRGRCYLAPGCHVIGSVELGDRVNIWFNAVIRADHDRIVIGDGTNIQDGCVLHADPGVPLVLGRDVVVGHKAMLHGCTVGDGSLIGINAVVLNRARIGRQCIVGANATVTEGTEIPDGSLVLGSPARVIRRLSEEELASLAKGGPYYVENAARFEALLHPLPFP